MDTKNIICENCRNYFRTSLSFSMNSDMGYCKKIIELNIKVKEIKVSKGAVKNKFDTCVSFEKKR